MSQVNITLNTNTVDINTTNNQIVVTDPINPNVVNITQPVTSIVEVITAGPQGPPGPSGSAGPSGSSGSTVNTGSLLTTASFNAYTGSNTSQFAGTASYAVNALTASYLSGYVSPFPYTGSALITGSLGITGSLNVTQGITGSLFGTSSQAISASWAPMRPGGSNTQIQYNNNGTLTGNSTFTFNNSNSSVAQGNNTTASGQYSHAEGQNTLASGNYSHAEGQFTTASGQFGAHAEGASTIASGESSHAEGWLSTASGSYSHAEGKGNLATGESSHAEGSSTTATGDSSHAEGWRTVASGDYQHVQGQYNISSSAQSAFIIGNGTSLANRSNLVFASGSQFQITGSLRVSGSITGSLFGTASYANSVNSIASNITNNGDNYLLTATGGGTINGEGQLTFDGTTFIANSRFQQGNSTDASGNYSHAEGSTTKAPGISSHAEGRGTRSFSNYSHTEGQETETGTQTSFIAAVNSGVFTIDSRYGNITPIFTVGNTLISDDTEYDNTYGKQLYTISDVSWDGNNTIITITDSSITTSYSNIGDPNYLFQWGDYRGEQTISSEYSHAEGYNTVTIGAYSHAEGNSTVAVGARSHAEGTSTIALGDSQHVQGRFNIPLTTSSSFIHGNGIDNANRSNLIHAYDSTVEITGSLNVSGSITGSLFGTATNAIQATQADYATSAGSATNATQADNATNAANAVSSSFAATASFAVSSSRAVSSSFATTASFAATSSNILGGKATHIPFFKTDTTLATSSLYQSGSSTVIINQDNATTANPEALYVWQPHPTSFNVISGKGDINNYLQLNIQNTNQGANASSDIVATANNGSENDNYIDMGVNSQNFAGFLGGPNDSYLYTHARNFWIGNINDGYNTYFFNSSSLLPIITLTSNSAIITGSLFGTASYATTSSYATVAGNGGVTQILAGTNVILSPTNGLGQVTINATGGNSGFNTATGSYGSFYDTGSVLAASATQIYSMSLSNTDISNGVFVSSSNGDRTKIKFTNAGVYNVQFSAQFSNTDNSTQDAIVWVRKNGTDIVDSSGTVGVPSQKAGTPGQAIASWNYYLSLSANDYIQLCWHTEAANVITLETIAAGTGPTHPRTPSIILTAQRVDTFLSNTGSFLGTFTGDLIGTASYATTASYFSGTVTSASYASTSSYSLNAISSSYATSAGTATNAQSASNFVVTSNVQIDGSLIDFSSVNSSVVGNNNLYQIATGSYTAAFTKYVVSNGANARAGEFVTVWNGTTVVNYDNSTTDIGNTTDVTFTSAIVTSQIKIDATTTTSGWTIKSTTTFI